MKKLLITSTALVLVAGAAVAEVKVGGNGRMGVVYNGEDWNFSSRVRVAFTLSGETDGGLAFGGSIRADNSGNGANGSAGNIWVSGAWGKISMGDVVGAAEAALFDLPEIGFTDIAANDVYYLTGDSSGITASQNPVLLYQYSTGDLSFYLSMSDGTLGGGTIGSSVFPGDDDQEYAVGLKYNFGNYSIGVGYEEKDRVAAGVDNATHAIIGGTATFGTTTVQAFYGSYKDEAAGYIDSVAHYGVGVTSKFDALTVMGFVQVREEGAGPGGDDVTYYGLGASYDLGGGASIVGGIGDSDLPGTDAVADIGLKFTF